MSTTETPARRCTSCGGAWTHIPSGKGTTHYSGFHGWCPRCYHRWLDHGKPAAGPPAVRQGQGGGRGASQLDDYGFLRSWGYTREQCAGRLGVTKRTIGRYEAQLRGRRAGTQDPSAASRGAAQAREASAAA